MKRKPNEICAEKVRKDEYVPFGDEWEKEMNKLPKKLLIELFRGSAIESKDLLNACQEILKHLLETDFDVCGTPNEKVAEWKAIIKKATSHSRA